MSKIVPALWAICRVESYSFAVGLQLTSSSIFVPVKGARDEMRLAILLLVLVSVVPATDQYTRIVGGHREEERPALPRLRTLGEGKAFPIPPEYESGIIDRKCGPDGTVYTFYLAGDSRFNVVHFDRNLEARQTYCFRTVPDATLRKYRVIDFAPSPNGGVLAIGASPSREGEKGAYMLFRFSPTGEFEGASSIDIQKPVRIGVFGNETVLLLGARDGGGKSGADFSAYIFRDDGTLLRALPLDARRLVNGSYQGQNEDLVVQLLSQMHISSAQNGNLFALSIESTDAKPTSPAFPRC